MTELDQRLHEDRALRDAALALFKADLAFIQNDLGEKGVGARLASRLGESTKDMVDEAVDYAGSNKGTVAAIVAAIVVWFARGPIIDGITRLLGEAEED